MLRRERWPERRRRSPGSYVISREERLDKNNKIRGPITPATMIKPPSTDDHQKVGGIVRPARE